jgi:hypothetical protein
MSIPAATLEQFTAALDAVADLPADVTALHVWDETTLLRANELHTKAARLLGAVGAAIAGELAYRSRSELGSDGLARRTGHRTVENLLKSTTGATREQVITADQLQAAAVDLVAAAVAGVDADRLWRTARDLRDELDLAGVKIREEEARALRGMTHHPLPSGGGIATWRMDPETTPPSSTSTTARPHPSAAGSASSTLPKPRGHTR